MFIFFSQRVGKKSSLHEPANFGLVKEGSGISTGCKGLAKLGNDVAETMFLVMFSGVAKLGNICFGRKICVREAKMFWTPDKKIFLLLSSIICFRNTCFPRG